MADDYIIWIDGSYDYTTGLGGGAVVVTERSESGAYKTVDVIGKSLPLCRDIFWAESYALYRAVQWVSNRIGRSRRATVTIHTDRYDLTRVVGDYWKPNHFCGVTLDIMEQSHKRINWSIIKVPRDENWHADLVANAARKGYNIPTKKALCNFERLPHTKRKRRMTVAELIAQLQTLDQNAIVIMQEDSEGNGYSPLAEVYDGSFYRPDSTWSGEIVDYELTEADREAGYDEEDITEPQEGDMPCVVLRPVN